MSAAKSLRECFEIVASPRITERPVAERHTLPLAGAYAEARATMPAPPVTAPPNATVMRIESVDFSAPIAPSFSAPATRRDDEPPPESGIWTVAPPPPEAESARDIAYWLRDLRPRG